MKSKANLMVLNAENNSDVPRQDWLKWLVSLILLLTGLVGNYYYSDLSMGVRMLGWGVLLILSGFVASKTQKGQWAVEFVKESRAELRKVVWPTREETMQTTLVVAVMVVILALVLWGMDGFLVWLIGWLTGQRS